MRDYWIKSIWIAALIGVSVVGFLDEGLLVFFSQGAQIHLIVSVVGFLDEGLLDLDWSCIDDNYEFQWLDF